MNMKDGRKIIALGMSAVMALTSFVFAGCNKKKEFAFDDLDWYTVKSEEVGTQYTDKDKIEFCQSSFAGMSDGQFYYLSSGQYKLAPDADLAAIDYNEYTIMNIDIYDINGGLQKTIDVREIVDITSLIPEGQSCPNGFSIRDPNTFHIKDGKLMFMIEFSLFPSWENDLYYVTYDLSKNKVTSYDEVFRDEEMTKKQDVLIPYSCNGSYAFDGYIVDTLTTYTLDGDLYIRVTRPNGKTKLYNMRDSLNGVITSEVTEVIYQENDKAIVGFLAGNRMNKYYYMMDLKDGSLTPYEEDTSWFSNYFDSCEVTYIEDAGYYLTDGNGIKKLDFEKKEAASVFSYDSCNINRYETRDLQIAGLSEEQIILSSSDMLVSSVTGESPAMKFFVLDKQDENPNINKKKIRAATLTEFDYTFCDAVCRFNDSSSDYMIVFDSQYSLMEMYLEGKIDSYTDGFDVEGLETQTELSDKLAVDLMSGDGPDIIIDGASYYQLNRDDLLMDLSGIDTTGLFTNVIDSALVEGHLYQLPLTVGINGLVVHKSDLASGQTGFTFEQYKDYVNTACNGADPIGLGPTDFFITCLSSLNEECISGGNINYDTDNFRSLADYVNDNVAEPSISPEDEIVDYYDFDNDEVPAQGEYKRDISFVSFLRDYYTEDIEDIMIAGLPSGDGRGPVLTVSSSVAIAAKTEYEDACLSFIGLLLSDDIQTSYGELTMSIPIKVSSFEASANSALEEINRQIRLGIEFKEIYGFSDSSMPNEEIDDSVIGDFEDIMLSCSSVASLDPEIMIIVKEEIPAYFSGQKSLDEVIPIINNRVSTFVNERG